MKNRLFICLLLLLLGVVSSTAQTPTTQGNDFWVSYMKNGHNPSQNTTMDRLTLVVSAKESCDVSVFDFNNNLIFSQPFHVNAGQVVIKSLPNNTIAYNAQTDGIADRGVHVTSTKDISLYIGNEANNSYDAANVLPTSALGTSYMVQTCNSVFYQNDNSDKIKASFLVIATEDNTTIQITPTAVTDNNHQVGAPYTVPLHRGQVYHVMTRDGSSNANDTKGDFSGTIIEANKPVSVFNGNCLVSIPGGLNTGYDHVFEQAMPTDYWGKKFVVTSSGCDKPNLGDDLVKITALVDNTTVTRDGNVLASLSAGQSTTFQMNLTAVPCTYLESSNPIAVYLYNHSHGSGNPQNGDPSMVWISPVEQTIEEVTFSTFQVQQVDAHYVNIICYADDVNQMKLDGNNIASEFLPVPGNNDFRYTRHYLGNGAQGSSYHTLSCPGGFVAYVYGVGTQEGYAYTVGSSARTLTNQLFVNDELIMNDYSTCQSETLEFRLETNYEPDLVKWNYGDGSPVEYGNEVSHAYAVADDYEVEVTVDHVVNGEPRTDTLGMIIHVNSKVELTCVDSTCNPVYVFQGIDFPVPFFGDTIITNAGGCESIYHMEISEGSSQSFLLYDTACLEYEWFDTIRYESGTYIVVLNQPGGCDSLFILNLTIGKPPENPVRYKSSCTPYNWDNRVICETTGPYYLSFTTEDHCVYDSVLYFTRYYEPPFQDIVGMSYVAEATNFWTGRYEYYLDDSTGMNTSHIQWELLDNPAGLGQWELRPHGASCTVTAYSKGERVLKVSTNNGQCDKERRKIINCTGYTVDEHEAALEVYPNPANEELVVKGEGLMEVRLYNMLGQRAKSVSAMSDAEAKVHVGDLPQALYILEARTKYGNITRLVSVIK